MLLSCPNYIGPYFGYELPHVGLADHMFIGPYSSNTTPNGPGPANMDGMHCAYTDGHAEWKGRGLLSSVYQRDFEWVLFAGTQAVRQTRRKCLAFQ